MKRIQPPATTAFASLGAAVAASLALATTPAQATSLSYLLDQSNVLADGVNYLQVDVSDGENGAINFTVQVLDALTSLAASNFGIQSFGFNIVAGGAAEALNISSLPAGWKAFDGKRMDGFGLFDVRLQGKGNARVDTLTFSITGIDGDTPADYAILSTGNADGGHQFFAAHVAGFQSGDCPGCDDSPDHSAASLRQRGGLSAQTAGGKPGDNGHRGWSRAWQHDWQGGMDEHWDDSWVKDCITSGYFGGSTTAVPLPGAAWLFITGAAGAFARARRRRAA